MSDADLLDDLSEAAQANVHARPCQVCQALAIMSDPARPVVERYLAGTIGAKKLADVLTANGYTVGRRAVQNHRREAHTP